MSRQNQQPKLDCWLAPEPADGGEESVETDDEEYDIQDSSLSIATMSTTSGFPAVLAAAGGHNSCGHNRDRAFSIIRNRVAAQVQESVSRVKSHLGRVMRRRPRYCSTACSTRLLLNYRHQASEISRRTQSADDSTTFSLRSAFCNEDCFGGERSRSTRTIATASISIDLSTKQSHNNLKNTPYPCTSSSEYVPKINIKNIQPPMPPRSAVGSAWGDAIEPRVAPGAGKTTQGRRRIYAPEFCLLANRYCSFSDANNSPETVRRRIYLPPDALISMAELSAGKKPQPLSRQEMRQVNTSEIIEVTVYAETSEEEITWPVPMLMNSSSAQDSLQQPLNDASVGRPPGANDGGGDGSGGGGGGGGGGGCCGCGSKAKARQPEIRQDRLPESSESLAMQGQSSSSSVLKLEYDSIELEGDISTLSIAVDTKLAAHENTFEEGNDSSISSANDWSVEEGKGALSSATTSTTGNLRRKSQQLPPLPEETMGEPTTAATDTAAANTMTPIPMKTTTEEEDSAPPPAGVPSKGPSGCAIKTLPHPKASMKSRKPLLALLETQPNPRHDVGSQYEQHPIPHLIQPFLTQPVAPSNQLCGLQIHKRSMPSSCYSSDIIATSHLRSEALEASFSRSSNSEKYQKTCRQNSEVIQPQNAFRHSSPLQAHYKPSRLLMPPQVSSKPLTQRTQPTPVPCKSSVLILPPELHAKKINRINSYESKSTNSLPSRETACRFTVKDDGIESNSRSSSSMTQELEISLVADGDPCKEPVQAVETSQCTISSCLVLDTDSTDSESAIYDLHVGVTSLQSLESDSGTIIEVLAENNHLSLNDSDSENGVRERINQPSQLSTGSEFFIEEIHVGYSTPTIKTLSQGIDMAANGSKSGFKYEKSRHSSESDETTIEEVHSSSNRLIQKSLSQGIDVLNSSKSSVKARGSRHWTWSHEISIEEAHMGYNSYRDTSLNKINHSVTSSRNNKVHSSSTNTYTTEKHDHLPVASFTMIESSSVDTISLNWNATNSYAVAPECLTIRPAVHTWTDAVLTEVDLPVARQTCTVCQVASLSTVNHSNDHSNESSYNEPATKSRTAVNTVSNRLSKLNRSCSTNENDTQDTDKSSVIFQLAIRVEDESSGNNGLVRDRPVVEVYADDDADWVWQQRQICLIQTPPLVLKAKTVPYGPAREERRISHQPMRIHQYLMPTKAAPVECAAFKGSVSWLADSHLLNFFQPKSDELRSVAGYRPVFSKVHRVPDRSLKLATTAPLQLLRNDTAGSMFSATVAAEVRGVAACECSTGSLAPMLSTKFSTADASGLSAGSASMWRRTNDLNASNNSEGRSAFTKRHLTSWLKQQTNAAAAAAAGGQKPLSTDSPPVLSPPQFAQIVYSSGESQWLCLTKPSHYQQHEEQHCLAEFGSGETNSHCEYISLNNWEALTGDTNNNNREDSPNAFWRWRPSLSPRLHHSTTLLIRNTAQRLCGRKRSQL